MPLLIARRSELAREATVDFASQAATTAMGITPDTALDEAQFQEFAGRVSRLLAENMVFGGWSNAPWAAKSASSQTESGEGA